MAKKVVATLQKKGGRGLAKVFKLVKPEKGGSYSYKEEMIPSEQVKEYFAKGENKMS